jgi:methylglyoxal synthase
MNETFPSELCDVLRSLKPEVNAYQDGEVIIPSGSAQEFLYVIREGSVRIKTKTGISINMHSPAVLGEISFLSGLKTTADVIASGNVTSEVYHQTDLVKALHIYPGQHQVYQYLTRLAIGRLAGNYHTRYIALIAHDKKKRDLIKFVADHKEFFAQHNLIATQTTGTIITEEIGLEIAVKVQSGPVGGDQQIGALITQGSVDAVFFFRDPLSAHPHIADVNALLRICEVTDTPLALNLATAQALVRAQGASGPNGN